ncbi:nitrogenase cofactor biosynthesis protein NifB [Rhodocista pekingensis]|uniref:FeMo cofactor biosynthesis protein NifB n=1 Tax=Rhodocista pekingensis TaxID=201185 RepID=A0ABW2KNR3_9PROT
MAQVIPLDSLLTGKAAAAAPKGGCTASTCGSAAGAASLPPDVWAKVKDHPCYSEEAHHYFARMHVAVAPACNIQCNYCNRKFDCANESRPGVVSERLTPEEGARKVLAVAASVPQLSVLGIAGPGDACYDWVRTRATFALVARRLPDIRLCLSTNGLALPELVDEIVDMNIDHVTVTINMVDPEVGERIYPWIYHDHRRWTGRDASRILHERQMEGLERLTARGVLVKVNSVMIPGINDAHLVEVNRQVTARGAFLHNIMPLISDPAHGTAFGLAGQRGPTARELAAVQDRLEGGAKLMRHCRQCRADAVGLLGEDRGQDFTLDRLGDPALEPAADDGAARAEYRAWVAAERADRAAAAAVAVTAIADAPALLVAVATKGGGRVNQHFGHAREFQIFEARGGRIAFAGLRRLDDAYCKGGWGDEDGLEGLLAALDGIALVLCARIGDCPRQRLAEAGIEVNDAHAYDYIETAIAAALTGRAQAAAVTA